MYELDLCGQRVHGVGGPPLFSQRWLEVEEERDVKRVAWGDERGVFMVRQVCAYFLI